MKPITPDEAQSQNVKGLPTQVIEAVNNMIRLNLVDGEVIIYQDELISEICRLMEKEKIDRRWLNIENIYREAGWNVEYDKPGFNETYRAHFIFTRKK